MHTVVFYANCKYNDQIDSKGFIRTHPQVLILVQFFLGVRDREKGILNTSHFKCKQRSENCSVCSHLTNPFLYCSIVNGTGMQLFTAKFCRMKGEKLRNLQNPVINLCNLSTLARTWHRVTALKTLAKELNALSGTYSACLNDFRGSLQGQSSLAALEWLTAIEMGIHIIFSTSICQVFIFLFSLSNFSTTGLGSLGQSQFVSVVLEK